MKKNYLALAILFFSSACLKKEQPVQLQPLAYESKASCTLNIDKLKSIFEQDISQDINCLEKNFEDYTRLVRTESNRPIEYTELKKFLQSHYMKTRSIPDNIFESAFAVISFFLGQPSDQIEVGKIKDTFQLIRFLNKNLPPILKQVKSNFEMDSGEREAFRSQLELFASQFKATIEAQSIENDSRRINIASLLDTMGQAGILSQRNMGIFDSWGGGLKRILVGGANEEISLKESVALVGKLPEIILFLEEFNYFNRDGLLSEAQSDRMYYTLFTIFPKLLHDGFEKDEVIIPMSRLSLMAQSLYSKYNFDFQQLEDHVAFLKNKLFDGKQRDWSYQDVVRASRWGQMIFGSSLFNGWTYRHYHGQSDSKIILGKKPPPLKNYDILLEQDLEWYWGRFKTIVTEYRYFKNNYTGQTFENEIPAGESTQDQKGLVNTFSLIELEQYKGKTVKSASNVTMLDFFLAKDKLEKYSDNLEKPIVEILNSISISKMVVSKLAEGYSKDRLLGKDELKRFLEEFSPFLKFLSIEMGVSDRAATRLLNQIDLLQFQSNGDEVADIKEITEFITSLFFARRLAADFYIDLGQHCPLRYNEIKKEHFFETKCYRERFVTKFFQERNHRIYFNGLLSDPVLMSDLKKQWGYFLHMEDLSKKGKTRDKQVMMGKSALVRMILHFFSIEGLNDRLDQDANGLIETREVVSMYPVFRNFISKEVGSPPWLLKWERREQLLKSIFLYIVKKKRKPEDYRFLWYHLVDRTFRRWNDSDQVTAERVDVIKIVRAILK